MKPNILKKGDIIGVIAQSEPIVGDGVEEINKSVKKFEELGLSVKFGKHAFNNPTRLWRIC